jgi:mono/diheme cytochrome c family protein
MTLSRTQTTRTSAALLALTAAAAIAGSALAQTPAAGRSQYPELTSGEAFYKGVCQGCHMPDAKGAVGAGAYPALAANAKLKVSAYPLLVVVRGQRAMPEFGTALNDGQIAEVVSYVRANFGNGYQDAVSGPDVAKFRPAP